MDRVVASNTDERIEEKINRTMNAAFENRVNVLFKNALADEPGM